MRTVRAWLLRLGGLFRKDRRERELASEMESHLQLHIDDNLRAGMNPVEARRNALIKLGGIEQTKENYRDRRSLLPLETLLQDLRFAARMLRKNPGFTAVAILTLALGIGANTTIFSVLHGVLYHPLPFKDADRLVVLTERNVHTHRQQDPAMATAFQWQHESKSFQQVEMAVDNKEDGTVTIGNQSQRLRFQFVTPNLPNMLGIKPILGRGFEASDPTRKDYSPAIISYGLWQRQWGGDPKVLGKSIGMIDSSYTIIGVMPPDTWVYPWSRDASVWVALDPTSDAREYPPDLRWLAVIAKLKTGVSLQQAQAEIKVFGQRLSQAHPETNRDWAAEALPLRESWFGDERKSFFLVMGAVGFVLLIACANVANLLLARSAARTTEMAIRASLGGSRFRLVRQLLTESVLLALIAAILGLGLSVAGVRLFILLTPNLPFADHIAIDASVLGFTLALAVFTGMLFGAAPAIRISAFNLSQSLKEGGDRSGGSSRQWGGNLLVVGELSLTVILLTGAGLMINSFLRLQAEDVGFNAAHLLTADVELDGAKYREFLEGNRQRVFPTTDDYFREVVDRLSKLPGATSAALEGDAGPCLVQISGRPVEGGEQSAGSCMEADAGYLQTMQIPLLQGRGLAASDNERSPWVAVVNKTWAARFFPGEDPVGKQIYLTYFEEQHQTPEGRPREIVGVVADARLFGPGRSIPSMAYLPYRQHIPIYLNGVAHTHMEKTLLVRTVGEPAALAHALRSTVSEIDRTQIVTDIQSMEQVRSDLFAPRRALTLIFGILSGLGIALAVVGIYSVMSYTVSQRTHEIGIRMALGAESANVLKLILTHGITLIVPGIVLGLAGALALTRLIANMLYGIHATDPVTLVAVSLLLLVAALTASYIPARRAMRVDPIVALRYE
jgi:predicted permease